MANKTVVRVIVYEGPDDWVDNVLAHSLKDGVMNMGSPTNPKRIIVQEINNPLLANLVEEFRNKLLYELPVFEVQPGDDSEPLRRGGTQPGNVLKHQHYFGNEKGIFKRNPNPEVDDEVRNWGRDKTKSTRS